MTAGDKGAATQAAAAVRLCVHGRVQQVGFRRFVRSAAQRYGLKGWVRNAYDGSVEIWAEGPRSSVMSLLADVQQGPSGSWVTDVEEAWTTPDGALDGFTIR